MIKVRDTLMNGGLANNGKRPVVAIDECQVLNVNKGYLPSLLSRQFPQLEVIEPSLINN